MLRRPGRWRLSYVLLAIAALAVADIVFIAILHTASPGAFIVLLVLIQAAVALVAGLLIYVQLRHVVRERRRHVIVGALVDALSATQDIEETASLATERLVKTGIAPAALLALRGGDADTFEPVAASGFPRGWQPRPTAAAIPAAPASTAQNAAEEEWLALLDPTRGPRLGVARIPIVHRDEVLGLVVLPAADPRATADDLLQQAIGSTIGAALVRARIYEEANDRARKLEDHHARRREFLSAVAHELRSPLTSIQAFTELWPGDGPGNPGQQALLDSLSTSIDRVRELADDLLDLCRVEEYSLPVQVTQVDVAACIRGIESALRPAFAARRQSLTVELPVNPLLVAADSRALDQILMNLISNANRFTPAEGSITIRVAATEGRVRIEVCDSGPGIDPSDRDRIFEPFYRVQRPGAPDVPGYGLGLAVAHRLTELQRGRIWVESADEGGAKFCLELSPPDASHA